MKAVTRERLPQASTQLKTKRGRNHWVRAGALLRGDEVNYGDMTLYAVTFTAAGTNASIVIVNSSPPGDRTLFVNAIQVLEEALGVPRRGFNNTRSRETRPTIPRPFWLSMAQMAHGGCNSAHQQHNLRIWKALPFDLNPPISLSFRVALQCHQAHHQHHRRIGNFPKMAPDVQHLLGVDRTQSVTTGLALHSTPWHIPEVGLAAEVLC